MSIALRKVKKYICKANKNFDGKQWTEKIPLLNIQHANICMP